MGSFMHSLPVDLNNKLNSILFENTETNAIGFPTAVKSCVLLHLLISIHFYPNRIEQLDQEFLLYRTGIVNQPYEYIETVLDIVQLIVNEKEPIEDDTDSSTCENNFLSVLSTSQKATISLTIKTSMQLYAELNQIVSMDRFYPFITIRSYTILSKLNVMIGEHSNKQLLELINKADPQPDNLRNAMYKLISVQLTESTIEWDEQFVDKLFESLKKISEPDNLDNLR